MLVSDGADNSFIDGHTLWLIGRYFNSALAGGDELQLIGYDTVDSEQISSFFDISDPAVEFAYSLSGLDIDFTKITSIRFEIRGTNDNFIDELRIARSYAEVARGPRSAIIPEPPTCLLMVLGFGLLALARSSGFLRS
jgi:hypothetical protein